jgi:hypothetical protein
MFQSDEDTEIVLAGRDPDAGACEFRAYLIESSRRNPFLRAVNEESRYWWVVRCLLC